MSSLSNASASTSSKSPEREQQEQEQEEQEEDVDTSSSQHPEEEDYYGVEKLSANLETFLTAISKRVEYLADATQQSVESKHRSVLKNEMLNADEQIAATNRVLKLCDELEQEFMKIRQIGEIASDFKSRVMALEKELT